MPRTVFLLSAREVRTLHLPDEDNDPGVHSDESMPSLQSVSDSSDDDFFSDRDDDDADDDDDDGYVDEDPDDLGLDDDLPRLIPANEDPPRHESRAHNAGPAAPRTRPDDQHVNSYAASENEREEPNENVRPTPRGFSAGLLRAIVGMDIPPQQYPTADPVLRSILGAMDSPRFVYEFLRLVPPSTRPDKDPQRAATIIAALETVPKALVSRYEKLRAGSDQDDFDGCPICRDDLVEDTPSLPAEDVAVFFAELPFNEIREPVILAFSCPGKHVFHDTCLIPWLERKTTCPSCRFDIDPHSLTLRIDEPTPRASSGSRSRVRQKWEPPQVTPFEHWLEAEEYKVLHPPTVPTPRPAAAINDAQLLSFNDAGPTALPTLQNPHSSVQTVDGEDDAWTTDEEAGGLGDTNDTAPRVSDYWTEAATMTAMRRYLNSQVSPSLADHHARPAQRDEDAEEDSAPRAYSPPVETWLASRAPPTRLISLGDDDSEDQDNADYAAERRRYLRSLMGPSNPLQLFLGDDDMAAPTLIPNRAADAQYQREVNSGDEEEEEDDLSPLI